MPWAMHLTSLAKQRRTLWTWPLALVFFGLALGLRLSLGPWLDLKFITFYPAVAAAALICGWTQGLLILLLSAVSAWYLFYEPYHSFELKEPNTITGVVGFLIVAGFILVLVAAMRELINRLEKAKRLQENLFGELQHRVANNFQLVAILLHNARRNVEDAAALEAIGLAEERISALSRLHRRLHDEVAMSAGLQYVIRDVVLENFRDLDVEATIDVEAGAHLSLRQITALALLANEAATNAAKHVFAKGLGRRFEISLTRDAPERLRLVIRDDGPGVDAQAAAVQHSASLGMNIMRAFASQLGGDLQVTDAPGFALRVEFAPA